MVVKMGYVGLNTLEILSECLLDESKIWSAGQMFEKPFVRQRGHIFSPVLLKDGQDVCLHDISDEFELFAK